MLDTKRTEEINSANEIEKMKLEFMSCIFDSTDGDFNLSDMISRISKYAIECFSCGRCAVFEIDSNSLINLCDTCADGVSTNGIVLEKESLAAISPVVDVLKGGKSVVINDINKIKKTNPELYMILYERDFFACILSPLISEEKLIGFIIIGNHNTEKNSLIVEYVDIISPYIVGLMKNAKKIKLLEHEVCHDSLTGAFNWNQLIKDSEIFKVSKRLGVIYCRINNIEICKGDFQEEITLPVIEFYNWIRRIFYKDSKEKIYRTSQYEFIILSTEYTEAKFIKMFGELKSDIKDIGCDIGYSWRDKGIDLWQQTAEIKKNFISTRASDRNLPNTACLPFNLGNKALNQYVRDNFFDADVLIRSVANRGSSNYIYFGDLQTNVFYVSDNMAERFDLGGNIVFDLIKKWEERIFSETELELYKKDITDTIAKKKNVHNLRYRVRDRNGDGIWIHCHGEVLWNKDKTKQLFFSGCITCQEDEFIVDPVTNFPKEAFAIRKLIENREKESMTRVIGFSLNHFNEINELKGKESGDLLLEDIARFLDCELGNKMFFCRLDGLRFVALVMQNCEDSEEKLIAELREIIISCYRKHKVIVQMPASFSYMTAPLYEMLPKEVISNTILLLNIAKASMEQSYVVYSTDSILAKKKYAEMVLELTKNIQNDFENFRIVIQPTYMADTLKIKGGEVLLRWKCKGENIPPDLFIPILEKTKMIKAVGKWVFENVIKTAKRLLVLNDDLELAFNVSYVQVIDDEFLQFMISTIAKYEINPSNLILELTETNFDSYPQKLSEFLSKCKNFGMQIALDDFGSGYSSLGILIKHPTSIVKLDRSLINASIEAEDKKKFITSIINSCHMFGKQVCAEGVETAEELTMVKEANCDIIQGYYFSKPLEVSDYFRLIAENI